MSDASFQKWAWNAHRKERKETSDAHRLQSSGDVLRSRMLPEKNWPEE
jgi:hypothetical protein